MHEDLGIDDCAMLPFGDPLRPLSAEEFAQVQARGDVSAMAVNGDARWGWWYGRGEDAVWRPCDMLGQHPVDF